jgi:adenosine deaminase
MASNTKPFNYTLRTIKAVAVPNGEPLYEVELTVHARSKARPQTTIRDCFTHDQLARLKCGLQVIKEGTRA